jgi:hypothetical protein
MATVNAAQSTIGARPPIPYREEPHGFAADGLGVLIVAVVLLAATSVVLTAAKRRGLLDRWVATLPKKTSSSGLALQQTLRLSPKTAVHVLSDGTIRHLIVESSVNAQVVRLGAIEVEYEKP